MTGAGIAASAIISSDPVVVGDVACDAPVLWQAPTNIAAKAAKMKV
jgi:hypothetical protein